MSPFDDTSHDDARKPKLEFDIQQVEFLDVRLTQKKANSACQH